MILKSKEKFMCFYKESNKDMRALNALKLLSAFVYVMFMLNLVMVARCCKKAICVFIKNYKLFVFIKQ